MLNAFMLLSHCFYIYKRTLETESNLIPDAMPESTKNSSNSIYENMKTINLYQNIYKQQKNDAVFYTIGSVCFSYFPYSTQHTHGHLQQVQFQFIHSIIILISLLAPCSLLYVRMYI